MKLHSKIKDYSLKLLDGALGKRNEILSGFEYERVFHFVDARVFKIYRDKINRFVGRDFILNIEANEQNKSYLNIARYYQALISAGFTRKDILLTIGGGTLQDISGFIASTLYRGIKWVFLPTTLLAQADSCIGSKTSINFGNTKNLIGTFYPPDAIYIDVGFCDTLTKGYFNSGVGEIIKFHLMSDQPRYRLLKRFLSASRLKKNKNLKAIILSTLKIKRSYFEGDEFDSGRRNLLNYGHCFGHALESASNFSVSHGEAVIAGMGFANLLSLKRKLMTKEKYAEFEALLERHYPRLDFSKINVDTLIAFMRRDKKRIGSHLTMVLAEGIGKQYKFNDVREAEIRDTYKDFIKIF